MGKYRNYSIEFKKQLAVELLEGQASLAELGRRHGIERSLIRLWSKKFEAGEYDDDGAQAQVLGEYEMRIADLERKVGQLTMELELAKKGARARPMPKDVISSIVSGPTPALRPVKGAR